jgi:hypothetical protein
MAKEPTPVGTITENHKDGTRREIPIHAPGASVRFSLGNAEAHPFVWRLWTSKSTTDFYLAVRETRHGVDSKYSFHASGDWRLQYERSVAETRGVPRIVSQWRQPDPDEDGTTFVTRILTPTNDIVTRNSPERDATKITWITPAPTGWINAFVFKMTVPGNDVSPPSDAPLIAAMQLPNGALLLVLHASGPSDPVALHAFDHMRREAAKNPPPGSPSAYTPRADPEYRCLVDAHEGAPDGPVSIWDLLM